MKNLYEGSERTSNVEEKIKTSNNDVKSFVRVRIVLDEHEDEKEKQTEVEPKKDEVNNDDNDYEKLIKELYSDLSTAMFASTVFVVFIDLVLFLVIASIETLPVILGSSVFVWFILTICIVHHMAKTRLRK